jgi:RimJ/RimL family protein N-acetyltransferase
MSISGKNLLKTLKEIAGISGPNLVLRVNGFPAFWLRPIATRSQNINYQDIALLTAWRNMYPKSFLTEFIATESQTFSWLTDRVHFDNKIIFMIENCESPVGYMGISFIDWNKSYLEPDSIVSGGIHPKGLMTAALLTLLQWSKGQLGLNNVGIRVLSDNPALTFYNRLGFVETKRVPLILKDKQSHYEWVEDAASINADRYLVYHYWSGVPSK